MHAARHLMSVSDGDHSALRGGEVLPLLAKAKGVRTRVLLLGRVASELGEIERTMRSGDAEVVTMADVDAALEALTREEFAATIVDGSPLDVENTLLRLEAFAAEHDRDIAVIVLGTESPAGAATVPSYRGGAIDVLYKPLDPALVRAKLALFAAFFRSRERLRSRLDASVRARDERIAVVSHDIRNPLSTVLMGARLIERFAAEGPAGATTRKAIATILRAVERVERLAVDLLDLAKIDAGHTLPVHRTEHDLASLIHVAVDSVQALASARRLAVTTDATSPILASCDAERVLQVLANLLGNAIKFTSEGGSVSVNVSGGDEGGEITVSVSDTGTGMSAEQLPFVFDPYWQVSSGKKGGAGLGLSIARAIVTAHGGRLWAESTPDVGSSFHFTLPSAR